jgi:tripartite-type tricarboxylate transporter receptor subunit TctC
MAVTVRALLALLLASFALTAQAQQYPAKPIRMIVSIAAGSVTDVIMRAAAAELQPRLGQPLVIENQGGASGIIAAKACAQAPADGYTVCIINHAQTSYNPLMFTKLPYDPEHDLVPVARLFLLIEGVFVNPSLGVNSIAELKALAKAKPDALNYATLGEGSFPELFMVWLNNQWGTKIVGIPYKGGGPAAQAVAANDVQMTRFGVGNFLGLIEAGKVKALAVASAKRSPLLPNVPTLEEAGLGGYPGEGWWGVAMPKGTPPAIVERLSKEFAGLFGEPKFVSFLDKQAVVSAPTTPAGFAEFLKKDRVTAETLIKIANTKKAEFKE